MKLSDTGRAQYHRNRAARFRTYSETLQVAGDRGVYLRIADLEEALARRVEQMSEPEIP